MSYDSPGAVAPAGQVCRYGLSRLLVRGPRRALDRPYVAFLGGAETFGRFVEQPFPELLERLLGRDCVNLGCINAGLDAFLHDADIMRIAQRAAAVVVQLPGAQDMSNRFYRVHPRRNDRFLAASPILAAIYPEIDFTEFHFNRHMLRTLLDRSEDRFDMMRQELTQAWTARMRLKLRMIGGRAVLLWLRRPSAAGDALGLEPLFVTRGMVDELRDEVAATVELTMEPAGTAGEIGDMIGGALDAPAAAHMPGPATHRRIAARLAEVLKPLL